MKPRRSTVWAGAAALGLVAAACSSGGHGTAGPSASAPGTGPSPTTVAPVVLAAGQEGSRAEIPWSQVGPGWLLAEWAPSPVAPDTDMTAANPQGTTVYLVDPEGGRYQIASGAAAPAGALIAWSADGQRALFETKAGDGSTPGYQLLDATNGTTSSIAFQPGITGQDRTVEFTKPHGLGIVEAGAYESSPSTVVPVQRYDLSGHLQVSYPAPGFPPAGSSTGSARGSIPFLYTPDGTQLLIATVGGLELVRNDGQVTAEPIPDPAGTTSCAPVEWWAANEALVACTTGGGTTLWLQPLSGDPPTELATEGAGAATAWQLTGGIFATDPKCIGSACTGVGRLNPDGTAIAPVGVLGRAPGQQVLVAGATADQLAIFGPPTGAATGFLEWLNPDTGATTALLGGTVNGGSVNQVLAEPAAAPTAPAPAEVASSPHFATPQAAMTYLASAWNRNDLVELGHVTNPAARAALADMRRDVTNLRLNHCTARPVGDYICYFDHDFLPGTATSPGAIGQAVFLAGPAATPGWYMTVFETCN